MDHAVHFRKNETTIPFPWTHCRLPEYLSGDNGRILSYSALIIYTKDTIITTKNGGGDVLVVSVPFFGIFVPPYYRLPLQRLFRYVRGYPAYN